MKPIKTLILLTVIGLALQACGGQEAKPASEKESSSPVTETKSTEDENVPASERVTLQDKGVGEITDLKLPEAIDKELAKTGQAIFKTNCTACHKPYEKFIGPAPKGILDRRSPEWIMNMILDPQLMVTDNQCARDLMVEFNGAAMANQNMTVEQARSILEYYRTL